MAKAKNKVESVKLEFGSVIKESLDRMIRQELERLTNNNIYIDAFLGGKKHILC